MQNTNYQTEPSISNLPSREGSGVCHVRAQPPKPKTSTRSPTNSTSPNSSKNTSIFAAPLTVTHPSIPSQEGKPPHHKPLITKKKTASQNSPLERGRGCVTPVHSHLKPKQPLKPNRHLLKNTSSQTSPLTVTHPFIPSQEGK